jgi:hypothetical protein
MASFISSRENLEPHSLQRQNTALQVLTRTTKPPQCLQIIAPLSQVLCKYMINTVVDFVTFFLTKFLLFVTNLLMSKNPRIVLSSLGETCLEETSRYRSGGPVKRETRLTVRFTCHVERMRDIPIKRPLTTESIKVTTSCNTLQD